MVPLHWLTGRKTPSYLLVPLTTWDCSTVTNWSRLAVCHGDKRMKYVELLIKSSFKCSVKSRNIHLNRFAYSICHLTRTFVPWKELWILPRRKIQGYKDIYSPVILKCAQEFELVISHSINVFKNVCSQQDDWLGDVPFIWCSNNILTDIAISHA